MKLDDATFEKWADWGQKIHDDLAIHLVNPRQIYRGFQEVVNANVQHLDRHDGGMFCEFVRDCYAIRIVATIRKHSKDDKSISLRRMMEEINKCASQFTYQRYLERNPIDANYVNWQLPTYGDFSDDGSTLSLPKINSDLATLAKLTSDVVTLCDKELLHLDKNGHSVSVTYGSLDECVTLFDKLVCKYLKLVNKDLSGYSTIEATILEDWQNVFYVPWDLRYSTWKDQNPADE